MGIRRDWVVYQWATGACWKVTPPTKHNAVRESWLMGAGFEAFRDDEAGRLHNAFAHGRINGMEIIRRGIS